MPSFLRSYVIVLGPEKDGKPVSGATRCARLVLCSITDSGNCYNGLTCKGSLEHTDAYLSIHAFLNPGKSPDLLAYHYPRYVPMGSIR